MEYDYIKAEKIMKWVIGIIGCLFLPPCISLVCGILLLIYATTLKSLPQKQNFFMLCGGYSILAGIVSAVFLSF